MRMADHHGAVDTTKYIALSESLAQRAAGAGNWDFAWEYWMEASRWHKRGPEPATNIQRCHIEAAECLAKNPFRAACPSTWRCSSRTEALGKRRRSWLSNHRPKSIPLACDGRPHHGRAGESLNAASLRPNALRRVMAPFSTAWDAVGAPNCHCNLLAKKKKTCES